MFPPGTSVSSHRWSCRTGKAVLAVLCAFYSAWTVSGGAGPVDVLSLPTGSNYVYVYDMPQHFTQDILSMPLDQNIQTWTQWYDLDQHVHRYHSLLIESGLPHHECLKHVTARVLEALQHVRQTSPYWDASNGQDHFMVFPMDHGRCHALAGENQHVMGELFAVQPTGDLALTDFETRSWYCYKPRRDVLVPVPLETVVQDAGAVHIPFAAARPISVLYRFAGGGAAGTVNFRTDPHNYSRTDLRSALLEQHLLNPIPGAVAGPATLMQTHMDMRQSVFCVCPNGISQHTLRVFRSILAGCIPVTFFRAFDNPLERNLGLDWSAFSVNINPDEYKLTQQTLAKLLANPRRITTMQTALQGVQPLFEWHSGRSDGVEHNMLRELNLLLDTSPVLASR